MAEKTIPKLRNWKHGDAQGGVTTEYRTWLLMKNRCANPRNEQFQHYGGRGIYVCAEWRESFPQFLADMGRKPTEKHSIDRIDNNGPYSKENCRWATPIEQQNNNRHNRFLTHQGRTQTTAMWARELGVNVNTLRVRLFSGWSVERTLTQKIGPHAMRSQVQCR